MTKRNAPVYNGTPRNHSIRLPHCIRECSGIRIFGMRIKSIAFTTDVAIIKNINADAIIAVYPFTPQPAISQAVIGISDVPVFVGVGGGITGGDRSVRLAIEAEIQGAFGVVVNAPISNEVISRIKEVVDIPVIATIVSDQMDIRSRIRLLRRFRYGAHMPRDRLQNPEQRRTGCGLRRLILGLLPVRKASSSAPAPPDCWQQCAQAPDIRPFARSRHRYQSPSPGRRYGWDRACRRTAFWDRLCGSRCRTSCPA